MTPASNPLAAHPKAFLAVSMAWAAGFVDVVSWLVLYHVYSSHMTGNTAGFADSIAESKWQDAFYHGWPILPFIAGLLYSAATTKIARRRGFHSSFSVALITELVLLACFIVAGSRYLGANGELQAPAPWVAYAMLALPAAAMGMQTVTVTRINGLRVYTTYLTGSLSKFSEAAVDYSFWFYDRMRHRFPHRLRRVLRLSPRRKSVQHAALTAGLWTGFFAGAVCGVFAEERFALLSLLAPMAILVVAVVVDVVRPVAAADEAVESDSAH